jgi:hypothetical protein
MKILLLSLLLVSCSANTVRTDAEKLRFKQCVQVKFESYCERTEQGLSHVLKEGIRTAIEIRFGTSIDDACAKHYGSWGMDYRDSIEDRIKYYCDDEVVDPRT